MPEYVPVSFSALPLASSVSPSDQTLVVQAGVAKRAPFSALPTAPAGPPGPPGSQIITGSASPTSSLGNNGDIYIQINTGDVYKKTGNTWNLIGNIKGPPGQPGQQGPAGQQGERGTQIYSGNNPPPQHLGLNGDYYINTTNGNLFRKQNGDWTLIYNLGSTGNSGSGTTVYFVENIPSNADGNDGDVAIDVGDDTYSGLIRYKYLGNWVYNNNQPKVMTNRNKRLFWGLVTSEEQRWDFDEQHHQIFDLYRNTTEFYIRFSHNERFYYEILGWEQQLHIRINRQADSNFTLTYRTINGTATLNSANQSGNVIGLDFNVTLGRGERMIFYNSGPFYTDQHYFIDTFRPSPNVPQNFGSMYFWIYQ